jgi:hypothetical protein
VIIAVQNLSTAVSSDDAYDMTLLVNQQVHQHVAPALGIQPPRVVFIEKTGQQKYDALIGILDDADQAGDLGWHSEGPDADVYGRVFANPVLQNGGNALTHVLSVCSVLSHEVIETIGDAFCNAWSQRADGALVAYELADPVESDSYAMTVTSEKGTTVAGTVSDFVFPAWFNPDAAPGTRLDQMSLLTAPFEVRSDGYVIVMSGGAVTEQWGETYPLWRLSTKESKTSRTSRRDPSVVPQQPTSLA